MYHEIFKILKVFKLTLGKPFRLAFFCWRNQLHKWANPKESFFRQKKPILMQIDKKHYLVIADLQHPKLFA